MAIDILGTINKSTSKLNGAYKPQMTTLSEAREIASKTYNKVTDAELYNYSEYKDNILDNYNNVTYYFSIYMIKESDYLLWNKTSGDKKDLIKYDKTILYRTGDTDHLSLERVSISSIINSNGNTHNITDTEIRIEIREPMGFGFIDDVYQNCYRLGYPTHMNVPIFIDFHMVGYNSDSGTPQIIENTDKVIIASITEFTPKLSIDGSSYDINLIPISQIGVNKDVFNLQDEITLDKEIINVESFFNQLQEKLNKNYQDNTPKFVEMICINPYEFDVDPILKKETINKNVLKSSGDNNGSSTWDFPANTSIQTICDKLLSSLESYKLDISVSGDSKTKTEDKWSIKIVPEVIYMGKCNINNQMVFKYIYHIKKYKNPSVIVSPTSSTESTADFSYLKRAGLLKKRYDFIYTGVNDHILDVNLNINHLLYAESHNKASEKSKNDTTSQQYIDGDTLWSFDKSVGDYIPSKINPNNYPANGNKQENVSFKTVNGLRATIKEDATYVSNTGNTGDKINGQDSKNDAIYKQLYNVTGLQQLSMTIKGDPYWYVMDTESNESICNEGQLAFLFQAKTPKRSTRVDQLNTFKDSITLSGVYLVNQVENIFEGGNFTQKITSIQDLNIKFDYTYEAD